MKKLSLYIFLGLLWCNVGYTDDIFEYQIEGISLGDSLLDHLSKGEIANEIEANKSAYNYLTDGGGVRFREAKNIREIDGFLFQDYNNYKPKNKATALDSLPKLFEKASLLLISEIKNKNIKVEIL